MAVSTQLYLCRHGQSVWNQQGLLQGQLESPLSALGQQQAKELAVKAQDWKISAIFSSKLGRAEQSAQICAAKLGLQNQTIIGLEERHFGQWQGQLPADISDYQLFTQQRYEDTEFKPGLSGESTAQVQQRMLQALLSLAQNHPTQNLLVISHGDALACLMNLWAPVLELPNTGGYKLNYQNQQLHWAGLLV